MKTKDEQIADLNTQISDLQAKLSERLSEEDIVKVITTLRDAQCKECDAGKDGLMCSLWSVRGKCRAEYISDEEIAKLLSGRIGIGRERLIEKIKQYALVLATHHWHQNYEKAVEELADSILEGGGRTQPINEALMRTCKATQDGTLKKAIGQALSQTKEQTGECSDKKETIELRLARIEKYLLELLSRPTNLTQDDWMKILNKPATF